MTRPGPQKGTPRGPQEPRYYLDIDQRTGQGLMKDRERPSIIVIKDSEIPRLQDLVYVANRSVRYKEKNFTP
jgi:hypothetical protein